MLDLFHLELPETITVKGSSYIIQTDFRYFILFYRFLMGKHSLEDYLVFFPFEKPLLEDMPEAISQLQLFANPPRELPRPMGGSNEIVLDYTVDADYIYSAFLEQYNIDLTDPEYKLHWYKFQALLLSLHDVKLVEIMSYRSWNEEKTEHAQQMRKLKNAWRLEQPESEEEIQARESFDMLFE